MVMIGRGFEIRLRCAVPSMFTVAEWAKGALAGISKGAPFSLSVTKHHYAAVAAAANSPENELSEV